MSVQRITLLAVACLLVAAARDAAAAPPRVRGIVLRPAQGPHVGPCPANLSFSGELKVDGPATVTYQFLRSDGVKSPVQSLKFTEAGTQPVHHEWSLEGPPKTTVKGWVKVKALAPNVLESRPAAVSVTCAPPAPASESGKSDSPH